MKVQRRHGLKIVFLIACACFTSLVILFTKIHTMSTESSPKPPFPTPRAEPGETELHISLIHAAIYSANATGLTFSALHMLVLSEDPFLNKEHFKCNSYTATTSGISTDVT